MPLVRRQDGGLDGVTGDRLEASHRDRAIDPDPANTDAEPRPDMTVIATALVTMRIAFAHAIEDAHHPSTTTAPHEAAEERAPTASRFAGAVLLHVGILEQEALVLLVFLPGDVAGMVVVQQDRPRLARFPVAIGGACAAV